LKIGLHTHITNAATHGYLGYLASVDSWLKVCDEVVLVDGGSVDHSLELLTGWVGQQDKLRVIATTESHWGAADAWEWPQIAINRQIGLQHLGADWAIHLDADHVLDNRTTGRIREELGQHQHHVLLDLWIGSFHNGAYRRKERKRSWILNLALIRGRNLQIAYGIDKHSGTGLDYPIWIESRRSFIEPGTGTAKDFYVGTEVVSEGAIEAESLRYGHFFFTPEQCLEKCMRIERAIARYRGGNPKSITEIRRGLRLDKIERCEPKEDLLAHDHPEEVKRVIERYYEPGMLGGAIYGTPNWRDRLGNQGYLLMQRVARKLKLRRRKNLQSGLGN
jgi:hypothetical protein